MFQKGLFAAESISQISLSRNQLAFQSQIDDKEDFLAVKNDQNDLNDDKKDGDESTLIFLAEKNDL